MTITAADQQAGSATRRRRRRKSTSTAAARRRREAAARTHRVVAASFVLTDLAAPRTPPPERLFVRRDVLDQGDVDALLSACSSSSRIGLRDRALIAAGYSACCRRWRPSACSSRTSMRPAAR